MSNSSQDEISDTRSVKEEVSEQTAIGKIEKKSLNHLLNRSRKVRKSQRNRIRKIFARGFSSFTKRVWNKKNAAAVRDAVNKPHENFSPLHAVDALSQLGFKCSFGNISLSKISESFFPLIAFKKDGTAVLIKSLSDEGKYIGIEKGLKSEVQTFDKSEFKEIFSEYFIIAKQLNKREKEERSGHWFFSAFRKSKWLYFQVMIAAMVSNFLSLTVSLFTMTVYDRIIPNAAFESLIALSIGAIIALGFDFFIKSLRARFIDTASKRADLEISRRLFDRILTLTPNEQRQKLSYGRYNSRI